MYIMEAKRETQDFRLSWNSLCVPWCQEGQVFQEIHELPVKYSTYNIQVWHFYDESFV